MRPNVPAMDEIESVLRDIQDIQEWLEELRHRLSELPRIMGVQLQTDAERLEAARYLYWMYPEIPSAAIARGLLCVNVARLIEMVGPEESSFHCARCGKPLLVRSRAQLQDLARKWRLRKKLLRYGHTPGWYAICNECQREEEARDAKRRQRREKRLQELKRMTYSEYLTTPEWQARRKEHLEFAGYRCQVCMSEEGPIEVYHRSTCNDFSDAWFTDLLALCPGCYRFLRDAGKVLVPEEGER